MGRLEKAAELEARARDLRMREALKDVDGVERWRVVKTPWGRFVVVRMTPREGHATEASAQAVADRQRELAAQRRAGT